MKSFYEYRGEASQQEADRLRRVAAKIESAAEELAACEGGGLLTKLASDLRHGAMEIEKRILRIPRWPKKENQ